MHVICLSCESKNVVKQSAANLVAKCGRCGEPLPLDAPGIPLVVTDENFREIVLEASKPTLVDFWAEWCMPCKQLSPALEKMAKIYVGRLKFAKVNTEENRRLATEFRIQSIPTLMIFEGGRLKNQIVGALPQGQLRNWINKTMGW
ncbi:thioredoxin TrxC [Magnetococcales bacterium HHB-1]